MVLGKIIKEKGHVMKEFDEIKVIVNSLIREVCETEDIQLEEYENFYEDGVLDSVKMMELVIRLEDAFEIEFLGDELYFGNFASLDNVCNIVAQKLDGGINLE